MNVTATAGKAAQNIPGYKAGNFTNLCLSLLILEVCRCWQELAYAAFQDFAMSAGYKSGSQTLHLHTFICQLLHQFDLPVRKFFGNLNIDFNELVAFKGSFKTRNAVAFHSDFGVILGSGCDL